MKNQAIRASVVSPSGDASRARGAAQSANPAATTLARRAPRKRACGGVGVSSSITAGAAGAAAAPCAGPWRNCCGARRPIPTPASAATATMIGNGTAATIATNESPAIAHAAGVFRARVPRRCAACTMMATTAGLTAAKAPATAGSVPNAT